MRISRDKLNKLAHTVADTLAEVDQVGFLEDRNTIRQEARKALEVLLAEEAKIDTSARLKIANQRKIILEGSQEWDILYRKYYNDEVRKLGIWEISPRVCFARAARLACVARATRQDESAQSPYQTCANSAGI